MNMHRLKTKKQQNKIFIYMQNKFTNVHMQMQTHTQLPLPKHTDTTYLYDIMKLIE